MNLRTNCLSVFDHLYALGSFLNLQAQTLQNLKLYKDKVREFPVKFIYAKYLILLGSRFFYFLFCEKS